MKNTGVSHVLHVLEADQRREIDKGRCRKSKQVRVNSHLTMAKILLIEDENSVASFIRKGLTEEGHDITVASDGSSGIVQGATHGYDVMDIMLPDKNGIDA